MRKKGWPIKGAGPVVAVIGINSLRYGAADGVEGRRARRNLHTHTHEGASDA